jgi:tRNA(fMet)-specific endonuclease VapC
MAVILDADVIIRGEKGLFNLQAWVASQPDEQFEVAAITVAELWHGLERATGKHRAKRQKYLEAVLAALPVIPYTEQTAYQHAKLWADLEASGNMIDAHDVIVAATALERDHDVAAFNVQHFSRVKGLRVIAPKYPPQSDG